MKERECIAMILADGCGAGLGALTNCSGKSTVVYGGSHRIIDFALSNCSHSGIDVIGVLTQCLNGGLGAYVGDGGRWNLSGQGGGAFMLPSRKNEINYRCPVDAVYRNIGFIEEFSPEYVCILSGDHIYKMDYAKMLGVHKKNNADATIAVVPVPFCELGQYGSVDIDEDEKILNVQPPYARFPSLGTARGKFAPMGVHIFNWNTLRRYLIADDRGSLKDFVSDVVPAMLFAGERLYAHRFEGYWRDVETLESLWKSNMDLLDDPPAFVLDEKGHEVFPAHLGQISCFAGGTGTVDRSILSGLHVILGRVEHSVLSDSVVVEKGAEVVDSILMPNVYVGENTKIYKTVVGPNVKIMNDVEIGAENGASHFLSDRICANGVSLIGPGVYVPENTRVQKNSCIENGLFADNFDFHTVCLDRRYETCVPPVLLTTA
ncbi:MAG: hypothetical protein LBP21_01645 [Synergistaceae bacterium]|jgi:glucose-1-phosphate adenylyltransferase|nr:hypothetical protein [Synergistaceae bacterium]